MNIVLPHKMLVVSAKTSVSVEEKRKFHFFPDRHNLSFRRSLFRARSTSLSIYLTYEQLEHRIFDGIPKVDLYPQDYTVVRQYWIHENTEKSARWFPVQGTLERVENCLEEDCEVKDRGERRADESRDVEDGMLLE